MASKFIMTDGAKAVDLWGDDPSVWTYLSGRQSDEGTQMTMRVAAAYRAFALKSNTVGNMPFVLLRGEDEIDNTQDWQNTVGFIPNPSEWIRLGTLSYMFTNSIYNLITSDALAYKARSLLSLVPYSFIPVTNPDGTGLDHIERWIGAKQEWYAPDGTPILGGAKNSRLIYLWRLDQTTELLPSENTEAAAIRNSVGVNFYSDLWIKHFFARGGVAPTVIGMKGAVMPDKRDEEERSWTEWLLGLGSRFRSRNARVFNAETLDVKQFGSSVTDLKENQTYKQAVENIAMGTGMPLSLLLANSANYSTAKEEKATWYENDIIPLCNWLAYEYNRQIFEPLGLRMEFRPETIDPQQEDETQRAGAISAFMDFMLKCPTYEVFAGAASTFGYELTDELLTAAKEYYKQKEERAEEMRENMENNAQNNQQNEQPEDEPKPQRAPVPRAVAPMPKAWQPTLDELEELKIWRKACIQRNKRGEGLVFYYEPHKGGLPENVTKDIRARLAEGGEWDDDRIKSVFELAQQVDQPSDYKILADVLNRLAEQDDKEVEK